MAIQIKIENFQNIESLSLRVEGFCVLVGESNIGKTSVVRALQCVTENTPAKSYIRHGKKAAKVQVAFPAAPGTKMQDGSPAKAVLVEWAREASVTYTVTKVGKDGTKEVEPFERVGRGVPDPITALRLLRADAADLQALIGLIRQGRYFWPLDDPNSIVKLIGELRAIVALNASLNTAKTERRAAKKERDYHERALAEADSALVRFAGVSDLDDVLAQVEAADLRVLGLTQKRDRLVALNSQLERVRAVYRPVKAEIASLAGADRLPLLLQGLETKQQEVAAHKARLAHLSQLSLRLDRAQAAIRPVPSINLPDFAAVERKVARLEALRTLQARVQRIVIKPVPSLELPSLERVEKSQQRLESLRLLARGAAAAEAKRASAQEELREIIAEGGRVTREFEAYRTTNPNCPTCGSRLPSVGLPES